MGAGATACSSCRYYLEGTLTDLLAALHSMQERRQAGTAAIRVASEPGGSPLVRTLRRLGLKPEKKKEPGRLLVLMGIAWFCSWLSPSAQSRERAGTASSGL